MVTLSKVPDPTWEQVSTERKAIMAKQRMLSSNVMAKAVGVGLVAGGLLLGAPAAMAFATGGPLDSTVNAAVNGANGAVQNLVNQNNAGLQGVTAINNGGLQAGVSSLNSAAQAAVPATTSAVTSTNGFVRFAVQGLLRLGS